ncbi:MAG: UDP-N-acetylmuramoyl-L-alanyl-D-glutamate--2,6-diaminopimelate ligase [Treponema sp.]|jgi:UDP-N-acetylmuramoyl-L-alanyl-D-glutamate--2,6-diaminopimelate ligase|nr:UDP-N-acetylmuramoyl-L-alanyl-D-glutamate--2,6-diaminopimelate ligase [Treponema sp.]
MNREKETSPYSRKLSVFFTDATAVKAGCTGLRPGKPGDPLVTGLEYDSRKVKPGSLYFALQGIHADGHSFIPQAVAQGASVIVHEKELEEYKTRVTYIRVQDSRFAMSPIAAAFYDHPSRRMAVIGVTGTEGKSTTVYLIYQFLRLLGFKAGFISTVMYGDGKNEFQNSEHQTTPEAVTVHKLLADMKQNGADFAVLEASSHGLSKRTNRLGDVSFDIGIMTNVTHEHLEFHGTWEQYRSDKAELFRSLENEARTGGKTGLKAKGSILVPSFAAVNADDPSAAYFSEAAKCKTYTYSVRGAPGDLSIRTIESGAAGNRYEVYSPGVGENLVIQDRLPGAFNAGNVLASLLAVSNLLSRNIRDLAALVLYLKPVRGRMTAISRGQPFEVLVDYAHTPSSFETLFPPLRKRLDASGGRIISLFGSAGERDTKKRPEQGRIAAEWSDILILTDEDPRGEKPMAILEEIAGGIKGRNREEDLFLIPDRPQAIKKAFALAKQGDLVLLLGKGHENSIIYADKVMPYDEIRQAEQSLDELGYPQETKPCHGQSRDSAGSAAP